MTDLDALVETLEVSGTDSRVQDAAAMVRAPTRPATWKPFASPVPIRVHRPRRWAEKRSKKSKLSPAAMEDQR